MLPPLSSMVLGAATLAIFTSPARGAEPAAPLAAVPGLEAPLPGGAFVLSIGGADDHATRGDQRFRSGWITGRAGARLTGSREGADDGSAWGILGAADGQLLGIELPGVEGAHRFYRLGASLGGFYVSPSRNVYWLDLGAFVAEQGSLLGSPTVRPRVLAIGTSRTSKTLTLLYGAGYTYDFGRGIPLPFLGLNWLFDPDWRLDVLLPVTARVTWRARDDLALGGNVALNGDVFEYQPVGTTSSNEEQLLRIVRLRLGLFGRYALSGSSFVRVALGVEGIRIDEGGAIQRASGGYLQVSFGAGSAGSAVLDPALPRTR